MPLSALVRSSIVASSFLSLAGLGAGVAHAHPARDAVYTQSNTAAGNEVIRVVRHRDGALGPVERVATGGLGASAGLGSQGAVALTASGKYLLAVNAGSNDVSVIATEGRGLRLVDRQPSGGVRPVSVTVQDGAVYVLNAGGDGNVAGFTLDGHGRLRPLPGAVRPLTSPTAAGAQVSLTPRGDALVVTEKGTGCVDVFPLDDDGRPGAPTCVPSAGPTPFGFAFAGDDTLVVSEAFGGAPLGSAVSSYHLEDDAYASLVTASAPTHQTAACWVAVDRAGRWAYAANAGSGSISAYRVDEDGALTLRDADGRTGVLGAGGRALDAALSHDGRYLYVVDAGRRTIASFATARDGSLTPIDETAPFPATPAGIAAR